MGTGRLQYHTAWFFVNLAVCTVLVAVMTALLCAGGVLEKSEPMAIFLVLELYAVACLAFAWAVVACFDHARVATVAGAVAYLFMFVPYVLFQMNTTFYPSNAAAMRAQLWASLLPPTALGLIMSQVVPMELMGSGMQMDNVFESFLACPSFTIGHGLCMLLLDTVIFLLLAAYVDLVFPGRYGIPLRPWFFLQPSFWCSRRRPAPSTEEDLPADAMVSVRHLSKSYQTTCVPRGSRGPALRDVSFDLQAGEISVLLGPNGAGKVLK